jgi:1-acyl-sn-glycerol-3-phosphate acyltransferase
MLEFYIRLYKFILSRRYRIHLQGADILKSPEPKIILPNHISHIDPQLISIITHEYTDFVPLVAERFFKVPVVKYFLRHLYAVKVPDLKKGRENIHLMRSINSDLLNVLKNNKSVVIFPAGQLSSGSIEKIHNKQSAFSLVASSPENVKVIGVRIRGMWGSMWSKAWNGKRPVFLSTYLLNIVLFFANLIFLCPKRKVFFTFVDITREARIRAQTDRKNFNLFLEEFYNEAGPEPPTFIRHLFFFPRIKNKLPEVFE